LSEVEIHYIGGVYGVLRHPPSNVPIPTARALTCFVLGTSCYHVYFRQQNAIAAFPTNQKCTPLRQKESPHAKTEAEKAGRGALKRAVNLLAGIYAFGCSDGNPVHMLSTASGSDQVTTVSRQIGKDKRDVPAPKTAKAYNAYMQGVDRHDQLRASFALTNWHGFKKWYVKMLINYSHSRNPPCAPARTHGQIQAPREPPN
jgi:hypothetical protein